MLHAGGHEQPDELVAGAVAHLRADTFKIANGVSGRHGRIGPAMKQNELAAARSELAQVRIGGIHQRAEPLDDARRIAIKVKLLNFPVRILLHHRADKSAAESRLRAVARFQAKDPAAPAADFRARRKTREGNVAVSSVHSLVNGLQAFNLLVSQTRIRFGPLTEQRLGLEMAGLRRADDAILRIALAIDLG